MPARCQYVKKLIFFNSAYDCYLGTRLYSRPILDSEEKKMEVLICESLRICRH